MIETSQAEKERILKEAGYLWEKRFILGEESLVINTPDGWQAIISPESHWANIGDKEYTEAISRMWTHYEAQL